MMSFRRFCKSKDLFSLFDLRLFEQKAPFLSSVVHSAVTKNNLRMLNCFIAPPKPPASLDERNLNIKDGPSKVLVTYNFFILFLWIISHEEAPAC